QHSIVIRTIDLRTEIQKWLAEQSPVPENANDAGFFANKHRTIRSPCDADGGVRRKRDNQLRKESRIIKRLRPSLFSEHETEREKQKKPSSKTTEKSHKTRTTLISI